MAAKSENVATAPPQMLTREQAAEFLGVKSNTLAVWASRGRYGLRFHRVGRCVRYSLKDLGEFLAGRAGTSTSQITANAGA